ncbi:HD-GYP domain-containing protein [Pseudomonas lalucatii]|uniref:HD-GYP domain-containing protein n=1 Tax=Pseudomonas lalucatii TaxID=1424203 RepID=A0ABS5Q1R1_9PSED|nr:HD-GYP domain-containing protein [Pseudomonas lalucatii]MBS7662702.1 HD-GYP domain-containing protein [Pseudomonas lalucatii]MBS7725756.1 HD-GYP domain-containing protein [Pseudomonas lalucatii]QVM88631.1 HD-GYP domain-containing protein [Pseudomonas lalucatii]
MGLLSFLGRAIGQPAQAAPATREAQAQLLASLLTMAWVVEARDPYTGGHLWRVSRFAELLAGAAGLDPAESARISLGGFLHDLGKIGIPDAILNKRTQLDADQYAVIKTHPEVGFRMLQGHPLAALVSDAVRLHHETPDGRGYPLGLRGDEIPPMARIVGIGDAFDAMTSSRPYRAGMAVGQALDIIEANLGRQFDAALGAHFLQLGRAGALDHIVGHSDLGIPLQTCIMCGPTLVLRRDQQAGEHLYCRSCGGEYRLEDDADGHLLARPTGASGKPDDLAPRADEQLIGELVQATARQLLGLAAPA